MAEIEIILNGEKKKVSKNITILKILETFEIDPTKVAIEKDLEIIGTDQFSNLKIQEGAKIEIVHFIGGG
jgi:thiazole synthase